MAGLDPAIHGLFPLSFESVFRTKYEAASAEHFSMYLDADERRRRTRIVVNEGGILPYCEAFYIFSILYSADRANEAFARFYSASKENSDAVSITSAIHEAIGHTAALSRFFWPSIDDQIANARSEKLRKAFGLNDSSPLRDRKLRNALKHFDEKLDRFLLANDTGNFFPTPIVDDHALAEEATARIFKLVDPEHGYFVILGEKYQFKPLAAEVRRILHLAQPMTNGGRLNVGHP